MSDAHFFPTLSLNKALCLHIPDDISIHTQFLECKFGRGLAGHCGTGGACAWRNECLTYSWTARYCRDWAGSKEGAEKELGVSEVID